MRLDEALERLKELSQEEWMLPSDLTALRIADVFIRAQLDPKVLSEDDLCVLLEIANAELEYINDIVGDALSVPKQTNVERLNEYLKERGLVLGGGTVAPGADPEAVAEQILNSLIELEERAIRGELDEAELD